MSAKDDFKIQLCWGLSCLTTLDAMLMFFSINCLPNFHPNMLRYSTLIPHDEEAQQSHSIPNNALLRCPFSVL